MRGDSGKICLGNYGQNLSMYGAYLLLAKVEDMEKMGKCIRGVLRYILGIT